jgi:hypothetical protein
MATVSDTILLYQRDVHFLVAPIVLSFPTLCEMTPFVAAPDIIMKRNEMQIPIVGLPSFNGMQTIAP